MAPLSIFTESFTGRLKTTVPEHLGRYQDVETWVEEFAAGGRWELQTSVEPELPSKLKLAALLSNPENGNLKDLENSISLHKALRILTPIQARDPRLWARLCHVEFWPYMRARWAVEKHLADPAKSVRYVHEHYFVLRSEGRALLHNGIARLWWYSHMTFDPDRENPYELTTTLLQTLDITKNILERSMGRSRVVLVSFLEFLIANPALLAPGDAARDRVRALARSLNLLGGVAILDCLTAGTIKNHLAGELEKIESQRISAGAAPASAVGN